MEHDPLCPYGGMMSEPDDCRLESGMRLCDLIRMVDARARADEREQDWRKHWRYGAVEAEVGERIADLIQMKFSMTSARSHDEGCVCILCAINSTVDAAVDWLKGESDGA